MAKLIACTASTPNCLVGNCFNLGGKKDIFFPYFSFIHIVNYSFIICAYTLFGACLKYLFRAGHNHAR